MTISKAKSFKPNNTLIEIKATLIRGHKKTLIVFL